MSLKTHLSRNFERSTGTALVIDAKVKGEANSRFTADANGKLRWGPGGGTALDTTLERVSAAKLKTPDSFEVAGTLTIAALSGVLKASSGAVSGSATTSDLPEGSNLYYTQARFDSAFSGKTTANLSEGSNLYFTNTRVDDRITSTWRGLANGLASLDSGAKIPTSQLPALAITDTFVVANQTAMLALSAQTGDVAVRTDLNKSFILKGTDPAVLGDWQELLTPTDAVLSVNGLTGAVNLTTSNIAEGSNLYHTEARVRDTVATGLNTGLTGAVTASDTILQALGRLENHRAILTTRGDLLYRDATSAARLALGAANNVLRSNGTDAVWGKVNLAVDVTGGLGAANGGTGITDQLTLGDTLYASGTATWSRVSGNTTSTRKFYRQTGNGTVSAAPDWDTLVAGDIPSLDAAKITAGIFGTARGGTGVDTTQANKVFAGPTGGGDAAPTFRLLVAADVPSLDAAKITTGQLALARGGSNADLSAAAQNSIFHMGASGFVAVSPSDGYLRRSGGAPHWHTLTGWSDPASYTTDRAINGNDALADVANVLATLIADLKSGKILSS